MLVSERRLSNGLRLTVRQNGLMEIKTLSDRGIACQLPLSCEIGAASVRVRSASALGKLRIAMTCNLMGNLYLETRSRQAQKTLWSGSIAKVYLRECISFAIE